jgi:hypothetical protein
MHQVETGNAESRNTHTLTKSEMNAKFTQVRVPNERIGLFLIVVSLSRSFNRVSI